MSIGDGLWDVDAARALDLPFVGVRPDGRAAALHARSAVSVAPSDRAAIRLAIEPFAGDVIAKMVVICGTLRAASGSL